MADSLMETIYGRRHKYEIRKKEGAFLASSTFSIYRDGQHWKGSFDSLSDAVAAAKAAD